VFGDYTNQKPSNDQVQTAQQTRPSEDSNPKYQVPQSCPSFQKSTSAQLHQRNLRHLQKEQIATQLFEQAPHDKLMYTGREKERDNGCGIFVDLHRGDGRMIDMS